MENCIFCKIANGEAPAHEIWENEDYMAFLSIYPNTEGFSVVIPKKHYPSYAFEVPEKVLTGLIKASKKVAELLDENLENVGRTGLMLEGYGVNHLHSKLFPMHGTDEEEWEKRGSDIDKYFEEYEGYISSHDSKRADDEKLSRLAQKIKPRSKKSGNF